MRWMPAPSGISSGSQKGSLIHGILAEADSALARKINGS